MTAGRTPRGRARQRERFARAADASPAPHDEPDPTLAGQTAVVALLRRLAGEIVPDAGARERMRARALAEVAAPGTNGSGAPSPHPRTKPGPRGGGPPTAPGGGRPPGRTAGTRGRLVIALGAAFCLVLALCGMTLLLSRGALPGDPLYAVRRTVESATLGLTSGVDARGRRHLEFAANRVSDVESLAARHPDPSNSPVGDYLTALADFTADAAAGSSDLTGYATTNAPGALGDLRGWADTQAGRLRAVRDRLPAPARTGDDTSVALLGRISHRAGALAARTDCYTVTSGRSDDLGVLPATGPCDRAPVGVTNAPVSGATPHVAMPTPTAATAPIVAGTAPVGSAAPTPSRGGGPAPSGPTAVPAPVLPVVPGPSVPPPPTTPPVLTLPLPLPGLNVPTLLPGLPGVRIGG